MGLVFYPKPQLDVVLHQTAQDTVYSYFDWWSAQATCINNQCILNLIIPVLTVSKARHIEKKNLHR